MDLRGGIYSSLPSEVLWQESLRSVESVYQVERALEGSGELSRVLMPKMENQSQ